MLLQLQMVLILELFLLRPEKVVPLKLKITDAPLLGGANARVHASVLSLYDTQRLQGPKANGTDISWEDLTFK